MTDSAVHCGEPSPSCTLVLYDGVCGLCNRLVKFLLHHDRADRFRFAPLQTEFARAILARHGLDTSDFDTVVVISNFGASSEKAFIRSEAVIRAAAQLGGVWKAAAIARFLPRILREALYKLVARRRYRVFGQFATCPLPDPQVRHKFLG